MRSTTGINAQRTLDRHEQVLRSALSEAYLDGWHATWKRRARALDDARPRVGDFTGRATRDELRARWHSLTRAAEACRAHARIAPLETVAADLDLILSEVAA